MYADLSSHFNNYKIHTLIKTQKIKLTHSSVSSSKFIDMTEIINRILKKVLTKTDVSLRMNLKDSHIAESLNDEIWESLLSLTTAVLNNCYIKHLRFSLNEILYKVMSEELINKKMNLKSEKIWNFVSAITKLTFITETD